MDQQNFEAISDEKLDSVVGGYFRVSQWRDYSTTHVFGPLNSVLDTASDNDRNVISSVLTVLQGTMIPGAEVAAPVRQLWTDYNIVYRPRVQSETVRITLDQALSRAVEYINQNA